MQEEGGEEREQELDGLVKFVTQQLSRELYIELLNGFRK
jgi:hypothetical protein